LKRIPRASLQQDFLPHSTVAPNAAGRTSTEPDVKLSTYDTSEKDGRTFVQEGVAGLNKALYLRLFFEGHHLSVITAYEAAWLPFSVAVQRKDSLNCQYKLNVRGAKGRKEDWQRSRKDKNPAREVVACLPAVRLPWVKRAEAGKPT
jgi:hypothetical protein